MDLTSIFASAMDTTWPLAATVWRLGVKLLAKRQGRGMIARWGRGHVQRSTDDLKHAALPCLESGETVGTQRTERPPVWRPPRVKPWVLQWRLLTSLLPSARSSTAEALLVTDRGPHSS
jgi:hypothetical protein